MSGQLHAFQNSDAEFFKDVIAIVEADHYSHHNLWCNYHHIPMYGIKIDSWKQENPGRLICVGQLDDRPVNIVVHWATLNDKRVMFWEAVSQVVDHKMIGKWFDHFTPKGVISVDANNFSQVVSKVR